LNLVNSSKANRKSSSISTVKDCSRIVAYLMKTTPCAVLSAPVP
jgi:hypothetical protein